MGYKVYWDEKHPNIIHNVYTGTVVLEDYYRVVEETYKMVRSVDYPVHTIFRYEDVTKRPSSLLQVMRHASKNIPSNLGTRVVVVNTVQGHFIRLFVRMGHQLGLELIKGVIMVASLEEGMEALVKLNQEMSKQA